jgi:hypothetical protein
MTISTRYIVQICIPGGEWKDLRKSRNSKAYTLTQEEAVAYMNTQSDSVRVWNQSTTVKTKDYVSAAYRVIKSTMTNGLINQEVVAGNVSTAEEAHGFSMYAPASNANTVMGVFEV